MQVAVLADCRQQRQLLAQVLQQAGCQVLYSGMPDISGLQRIQQQPVDVWLVSLADPDELAEGLLERLYGSDVPVLVDEGVTPEPGSEAFARWHRQLEDKLARVGRGLPDAAVSSAPDIGPPVAGAEQVWLLAASLGGLTAVKEFLDNLPDGLPVAFLYAQHIDPAFETQLPRAVGRHSQWPVQLAREGQLLAAGEVVVVPTRQQLAFDGDGRLSLLDQPWPGSYTPSINGMMRVLARQYGHCSGIIVFSGMGDDGSAACAEASECGMLIWVQDAESCTCPAMPDSVRQTGLSRYSATPRHLALALLNHVRARHSAAR